MYFIDSSFVEAFKQVGRVGEGCGKGAGRVREGCGKGAGRVREGCGKGVGRVLGRIREGGELKQES